MIYINSLDKLSDYIKKRIPSVYVQSMTSTVIPYHKFHKTLDMPSMLRSSELVNLSGMEKEIKINEFSQSVIVKGPVTWNELKEYLAEFGFRPLITPTEELASVLAGLSTSYTGENSFGFGPVRDHVISCKYLNYNCDLIVLNSKKEISLPGCKNHLKNYRKIYSKYKNFKNAPFPRLEKETDLMIGSEGQLGIIIEAEIKIIKMLNTKIYTILLPRWEKDFTLHLKLYKNVQKLKGQIVSVELIDSNALKLLSSDQWYYGGEYDAIFLEVNSEADLDCIWGIIFHNIKNINEDLVFCLENSKYHMIRMKVPRAIQEKVNVINKIKIGTDTQVECKYLNKLFDYYRSFSNLNIPYVLFGHLGDAHLHFNFLASQEQFETTDKIMELFYHEISKWGCSPFAEHGIGILKKKYISSFWSKDIYEVFSFLKLTYDPYLQFFPSGYMTIKNISQNIL